MGEPVITGAQPAQQEQNTTGIAVGRTGRVPYTAQQEPLSSLLGKLIGAAMDLEREQGSNAGMDESSSAWQLVKSLERRVLKAAQPAPLNAQQAEPSAWPMLGVRVNGDEVIIKARGFAKRGNDNARWICKSIIDSAWGGDVHQV